MKRSLLQTGLLALVLLGVSLAPQSHAVPPPLPDFVIESLSIFPTNVAEGMRVTVTVIVKNQGAVAGDGRYLDIWNNTTNDSPVFGDVGDWWTPVGHLEPGASRTLVSTPTIVVGPGTNQLFACIEFEDFVSETSNANNCHSLTFNTVPVHSLLVPVHRFWSHQFGSHFYIIGDDERDRIAAKYTGIWNYEEVAWYAYPAQVPGTEPVHRFWSDILGKHFYILGDSERDRIAAKYLGVWNYEAVAWYAYPNPVAGTDPVGRFWSDQFMGHFYIITQPEIDRIAAKYPGVWNYEAIAYWAFTVLPDMNGNSGLALAPPMGFVAVGNGEKSQDERSMIFDTAPRFHNEVYSGYDDASPSFDVVYPLAYPRCQVAAQVYDSATEQWTCVLAVTNSPGIAVLKSVKPDRSYLVEVFTSDSADGELTSVHRSWFDYQLDPPETFNGEDLSKGTLDGVGMPTLRIRMPAEAGTQTVKLYSSKVGVVQTLIDVSGGDTVELPLPEWNRWYWVGGWRDADNTLVMSLWLRHATVE